MKPTMHEAEYLNISNNEKQHWWYRSLHQLVLANIKKYFNRKELSIIDAGCGTGGLISFLRERGYKDIKGFDISETAVQICRNKGLDVFKGSLNSVTEYFDEQSADVLISNDTFYFFTFEDQREITDAVSRLLRKDGLLIINIPALKAFRGIHDIRVGISERLSDKDIPKIYDKAKYNRVEKIYWPFFLSPVIWLTRYIQRMKIKTLKRVSVESDVKDEGGILNSVLYSMTNLENNLLRRKPFGSSLLLVLKKK